MSQVSGLCVCGVGGAKDKEADALGLKEYPRSELSLLELRTQTLPTASLTICPFGEVNDSITVRPYMEVTSVTEPVFACFLPRDWLRYFGQGGQYDH